MRSISFSLTEPQFLDGSKDVTRRQGWLKLKVGDRLRAVRKAMGLKKGEKQFVLGEIEVVSVRREKLNRLTDTIGYGWIEVMREGFPDMTLGEFVEFFCGSHHGCTPEAIVTRIEFRKINFREESRNQKCTTTNTPNQPLAGEATSKTTRPGRSSAGSQSTVDTFPIVRSVISTEPERAIPARACFPQNVPDQQRGENHSKE